MYKNGTIWKDSSGGVYLLQYLTASIYCLLKTGNDGLSVVLGDNGKWQYAEDELPEMMKEFTPINAQLSIQHPTDSPPAQKRKNK